MRRMITRRSSDRGNQNRRVVRPSTLTVIYSTDPTHSRCNKPPERKDAQTELAIRLSLFPLSGPHRSHLRCIFRFLSEAPSHTAISFASLRQEGSAPIAPLEKIPGRPTPPIVGKPAVKHADYIAPILKRPTKAPRARRLYRSYIEAASNPIS